LTSIPFLVLILIPFVIESIAVASWPALPSSSSILVVVLPMHASAYRPFDVHLAQSLLGSALKAGNEAAAAAQAK